MVQGCRNKNVHVVNIDTCWEVPSPAKSMLLTKVSEKLQLIAALCNKIWQQ